jgi:branched-chain amino acid transport system permease protein
MSLFMLVQGILLGVSLGSIYVLMALGLTLMFGILGIVNLAHGVFYMLGAYGIYYLYQVFGLNFQLAMTATIVTLGFCGLFLERVFYRTVRGEFAPVIVLTVGLATILESVGYLVFGVEARAPESPISGHASVLGYSLSGARLLVIATAGVLVSALYLLIHKTSLGRKMRAVEEDRIAAALQGIDANRINAIVFALGIGLAAAAGALIAPIYSVEPSMGTLPMCKAFMVIVLGGLGSVPGAILGGIVIGLADSLLGMTLGIELAYIFTWVLIIIILIIRPRGLLGAY